MPFTPEETANMHSMLKKSLEDLHAEKKRAAGKWTDKLKKLDLIVNFQIMGPDFKENAGYLHAILKNGEITVKEGKSNEALLEFKAPLMNFFQFSSNEISLLSALLGKLKIKGKRYMLRLYTVASLLRVIPEKKLQK